MARSDDPLVRLQRRVAEHGSLLVAYSGGVDSTVVLKVAYDVLGARALGVTADSPSLPRRELDRARRVAATIGARHVVVATGELDDPGYAANAGDRCYFCKHALYTRLGSLVEAEGIRRIANGTNLDDLGDYRPGLRAAAELEVVSPLRDAGLGKRDVRRLARRLGLPVWDKPASPCLSSRIPYGSPVTRGKLAAVEAAEAYLSELPLRELRVRHFGPAARIEVPAEDLEVVRSRMAAIGRRFAALGFARIELAEFRSGALNDALDPTGLGE